MAIVNATAPTYTQQVDQSVFIEPLGGPLGPLNALDRFPDSVYSKSPETHFVKFMYSLLGPAGVGFIKKQYLEAKLEIYAQGFNTFQIEKYYGDPFAFGRILEEELPDDPRGLLTREQWDIIKSKDESYRSRAIMFFNAARLGTTPEGMELAAESGLNHPAIIWENYKTLFDIHSDEPLGLPHLGRTTATEEFVIVPHLETSRSEQQVLSFANAAAVKGTFQLEFNGVRTATIAYNADNFAVEKALKALPTIGKGNIQVQGGPCPNPFIITFTGLLSNRDVAELVPYSFLQDNLENPVALSIKTLVGGVAAEDEKVVLSDEYQHNAQTAIDFLRPLNTLPTPAPGKATRTKQEYRAVASSSNYQEAIKYVTGSESIKWPEPDSLNWIEPGKEIESKRLQGDLEAHYAAYHTVSGLTAYTDNALTDPEYENLTSILANYKSEHVGRYDPRTTEGFPQFESIIDDTIVFDAKKALPPCSIPMEVTVTDDETLSPLLGGILYVAAIDEDGSGSIALSGQNWWSSLERHAPASDYLEIDLGETRIVNFINFEISRKPCFIDLTYDHYDMSIPNAVLQISTPTTPRVWTNATFPNVLGGNSTAFYEGRTWASGVVYSPSMPAWQQIKVFFADPNEHTVASRFLRLRFARPDPNRENPAEPFLDPISREPIPYTIDVRNIRVGRYSGTNPNWNNV